MRNAKRIARHIAGDIILKAELCDTGQIEGVLKQLDPRAAAIIEMRFGLNGEDSMTLKAIGERAGIPRSRVRRVVNEARRELKKIITAEPDAVARV